MSSIQPIAMFIAGAQKAGTTSLMHLLTQHPAIKTHRQAEMSFFVNDSEYELGHEYAWKKYFGVLRSDNATLLAKHVLLMNCETALRRLVEHNPQVHIVLSLRNPVDRAYSSYWYARRKAWEQLSTFEEAIAAESARLVDGWYKWRRNCYLLGSRYIESIETISRLVEPNHLHVFTTDELSSSPRGVCSTLFQALDLDPSFEPEIGITHNRSASVRSTKIAAAVSKLASSQHPVRNAVRRILPYAWTDQIRRIIDHFNEVDFEPPPLTEQMRRELVEYFRPYNRRLENLLERDLSGWNG